MTEKTADDFVFFWKPDGPNGWAGQWYPSPFTARVALPGSESGEEGEVREVRFLTAEHWMMAQKALLFGDREVFERIVGLSSAVPAVTSAPSSTTSTTGTGPTRSTRSRPSKAPSTSPVPVPAKQKQNPNPKPPKIPTPKEAKALGRKVKNFDDATWARERGRIVLEGSLHKFRQNAGLRRMLFRTGERELVEASPLDRIWGIGMGERRARETCGGKEGREGWGMNLLGRALGEARAVLRGEFKNEVEGEGEGEAKDGDAEEASG